MTSAARSVTRRHEGRAFTLIEVLATVALLGLVMSVSFFGLRGVLDAAAMREAVSMLKEVDARTRVAARSLGSMQLRTSDEGDLIDGRVVATGETVVSRVLPRGLIVRLADSTGQPSVYVDIDAMGRSADFVIELIGPQRTTTLEVSGITGWIIEVES